MSITGVDPTWIQHNTDTKDFTVPFTQNKAAIGDYIITIRNEISVPDSADKLSFTPQIVQYDFTISIQPCQVNTFT